MNTTVHKKCQILNLCSSINSYVQATKGVTLSPSEAVEGTNSCVSFDLGMNLILFT